MPNTALSAALDRVFAFTGPHDVRRARLINALDAVGDAIERALREMVRVPMLPGVTSYAVGMEVAGGPAKGSQALVEMAVAGGEVESFEQRERALTAREQEVTDAWLKIAGTPPPLGDKERLH